MDNDIDMFKDLILLDLNIAVFEVFKPSNSFDCSGFSFTCCVPLTLVFCVSLCYIGWTRADLLAFFLINLCVSCTLSHDQIENRPNQTGVMIHSSQVVDLWKVPENVTDQILVCFHVACFTLNIFYYAASGLLTEAASPNDEAASCCCCCCSVGPTLVSFPVSCCAELFPV